MKIQKESYGIIIHELQPLSKVKSIMEEIMVELYLEILMLLNDGKLHFIIFDLLEEEAFKECFYKTKDELKHLKTEQFF